MPSVRIISGSGIYTPQSGNIPEKVEFGIVLVNLKIEICIFENLDNSGYSEVIFKLRVSKLPGSMD